MAGDVIKLNVGVSRNATKWQENTLHKILFHGSADAIQMRQIIEVSMVIT